LKNILNSDEEPDFLTGKSTDGKKISYCMPTGHQAMISRLAMVPAVFPVRPFFEKYLVYPLPQSQSKDND
jgi:hypothetical protein